MGIASEFILKYWYVFVLLAGLLIFWFYSKLDYVTKRNLRQFMSGGRLAIILYAIIWVVWWKKGSMLSTSTAHFYMPLIGLVVLIGYHYMGSLRYRTRQVICANYHGSFGPDPIRINGFLIFSIGSFNAGGLSWSEAQEILIIREETGEMFDKGFVSIARVSPASIYEQDADVKHTIENTPYLKRAVSKIYYGWFDDINAIDWSEEQLQAFQQNKRQDELYSFLKLELGINNPSIKEMVRLYRNMAKAYNKLLENYDSTIEGIEKYAEHNQRIRNAYVDKKSEIKVEGYEENV